MLTRKEYRARDIASLKSQWLADPCFDLDMTYINGQRLTPTEIEELKDFQRNWEHRWKHEEMEKGYKKAEELGCSPQLARYIMNLNENIKHLTEEINRLKKEG
jgi:hypothetical protein